jgi:hypothetical protein
LYKQNKEALDLVLKVRRHQIDAAPGSKINGAKIKPNLLPLRTIYGTHTQRLSTRIKKSWIAEIGNDRLSQLSFKARDFSSRQLT